MLRILSRHVALLAVLVARLLAVDSFVTTTRTFLTSKNANSYASLLSLSTTSDTAVDTVDVAIIGAGLGGLCAGAVLNTLYNRNVHIFEAHYLAGGCAHAYNRPVRLGNNITSSICFDAGPTIMLGCSSPPYNALQQILLAINQTVEWIPYNGWSMIENPGKPDKELRWQLQLGPDHFTQGPLAQYSKQFYNIEPDSAIAEFNALRDATKELLAGASIPALAMRADKAALIPLLGKYFSTITAIIKQGSALTDTFAPYMDGPKFTVTNPWLRSWIDALAFSLSGLPAVRTSAAALAFVLQDMHSSNTKTTLDYPKGGMGQIVDALVRGVEQGSRGSKVNLKTKVDRIIFNDDATRATGIVLSNGKTVNVRQGVICNAPVWCLRELIKDEKVLQKLSDSSTALNKAMQPPPTSWIVHDGDVSNNSKSPTIRYKKPNITTNSNALLDKCDTAEQTGSFLHLHLVLNTTGLDLSQLAPHYTVMDRGLSGDNDENDGPCAELNMIAVSNPCILDDTLAPEGYIIMHAYGAANEPYQLWQDMDRRSQEYKDLKMKRSQVLWRAVESVIPDARQRAVLAEVGSPLTHQRYLRRPAGTYGSATEDYLPNGDCGPISNLKLAGDGVFPGIGIPAVAISGVSAANGLVNVWEHWKCLDRVEQR